MEEKPVKMKPGKVLCMADVMINDDNTFFKSFFFTLTFTNA